MDSVRKEVVVEAPVERAFRVFTERFDAWWPRDHHILKAPLAKAVIEPAAGGRWYEIATDGSECDWGKVLVWDPPKRLVMAWQLNGTWDYDPNLITELELRFTPLGDMKTRVELEHRHLERLGELAEQTYATLNSSEGWITHLTLFAKEASRAEARV